MAKKGAAQQLQAELNNDEDFEKFIQKHSEALIDVYSEWSGPCLSLVNALKKIKLELGGDKLQLAICKSDYITKLKRFRKKSEPTWLFVRAGKSINLMFGSDVPKLLQMIQTELSMLTAPIYQRGFIEIDELHPEEQRREQIINELSSALEQKERRNAEKRRRDYLMYCTDIILKNQPDMGVSVFGPQVHRDMFKKINEPAESLKISCKDRQFRYVTSADFETVNFACANPLPNEIIEELTKQEILLCFWKISDETNGNVPQAMKRYVHELTKIRMEPPDESKKPPILEPIKVNVSYEVEDHVICPTNESEPKPHKSIIPVDMALEKVIEEELALEVQGEEEEDDGEGEVHQPTDMDMASFDMSGDVSEVEYEAEEEAPEGTPEATPPHKTCLKTITVPPIWVADDERTNAALIYVFFRNQTLTFLPPDPPPEPPVIIMAFDTHKKRELVSIAERNKSEIPNYGFFTSDDAEEATLITNSAQEYAKHPASSTDKLVLEVNKRTSQMMLSLAAYGATYVSPNTQIGKKEAKTFFPEGYQSAQEQKTDGNEIQKEELIPDNENALETEKEDIDVEEAVEGADPGEATELGEEEFDFEATAIEEE